MTVRDPDATGFEPSLRVVAGDPLEARTPVPAARRSFRAPGPASSADSTPSERRARALRAPNKESRLTNLERNANLTDSTFRWKPDRLHHNKEAIG